MEEQPSRLVKINRIMRIVWGVITAVLFLVVLFLFLKKESGY
jgi:hypothetical protein